jgi:hypothetical protein
LVIPLSITYNDEESEIGSSNGSNHSIQRNPIEHNINNYQSNNNLDKSVNSLVELQSRRNENNRLEKES